MNYRTKGLLFLLFFPLLLGAQQQDWMKGRVVVKIAPQYRGACTDTSIQIAGVSELFAKVGVHKIEKKFIGAQPLSLRQQKANPKLVDLSLVYDIHFDPTVSVSMFAQKLGRFGAVVYAEPEFVYQIQAYTPSDPNIGGQGTNYYNQMKVFEGWDIQKGDTNVVIAIIDASITWDHIDLVDNVKINTTDPVNGFDDDNDGYIDNYAGWDFVGSDGKPNTFGLISVVPDNDTRPGYQSVPPGSSLSPVLEHGTWVTGVASATTDNATGVAGTGFKCKFLPIKLMHDYNGGGLYFVTQAIYYAASHGASVINLSLGSAFYSQAMQDAVNFATLNEDCAVVAASGNGISEQILYPASYDNVLSVSSVNSADGVANAYGSTVDVLAPGSAYTTYGLSQNNYSSPAGIYSSISCPLVAGLAGLVRAQYPSYTAQQTIERVRVTADEVYTQNPSPTYQYKLGKGRVNFLTALQQSSPSIRMTEFKVVDGADDVLVPGDQFDILGTFENFLETTTNLTISISTADPNVDVVNGIFTVGQLPTLSDTSNAPGAFRFNILSGAPLNHTVEFLVSYSDGLYTDFELFTIVINPSFANVFSGNVATSIGMNGKWGQNAYAPVTWQGLQYQFGSFNDYLWEGGFLIGNSTTSLANNIRKPGGSRDTHLASVQKPVSIKTPKNSDEEVFSIMNDSGLGAEANDLTIKQNAYGFYDDTYQNIIIYKYTIQNPKAFNVNNLYAAVAADWDYNTNALEDTAGYDAARKLLYSWGIDNPGSRDGCDTYMGMVLLEDTYPVNATTENVTTFSFTQVDKFGSISNGTTNATGQGLDVFQMLGIGPVNILPQDSAQFAIAIVSGCSLQDIQALADTARSKYTCMFKQSALNVNLAPDYVACDSIIIDATTTGAQTYAWTPVSLGTNPVQTIKSTGIYGVTAFDQDGCPYTDEVNVTIVPTPNPSVTLNNSTLSLADGALLSFSDATPFGQTWTWNFGNGFGFSGQSGSYEYLSEGNYTLQLTVSNGTCATTVDSTITVVPFMVGREDAEDKQLQVYPNPAKPGTLLYAGLNAVEAANLALLDLQGRVVHQADFVDARDMELNIPQLPTSIYMLRVTTGSGSYYKKILIQ